MSLILLIKALREDLEQTFASAWVGIDLIIYVICWQLLLELILVVSQ